MKDITARINHVRSVTYVQIAKARMGAENCPFGIWLRSPDFDSSIVIFEGVGNPSSNPWP